MYIQKQNQIILQHFISQYILKGMSYKLFNLADERKPSFNHNRRISVSTIEINCYRSSLDMRKDKQKQFRTSDISNVRKALQIMDKRKTKASPKSRQLKNTSNLFITFQNLTQKLDFAKKQLNIKKENSMPDFSFQLYPIKQSQERDQTSFSRDMLHKMQETTINFESRKQLIPHLKNKNQIFWANSLKTYYVSDLIRGLAGINQDALEHLTLSWTVLSKFQEQVILTQKNCQKKIILPLSSANTSKKVLILDLDETLIHCEDTRMSPEDLQIEMPMDECLEKAYISIRPYALSFLKKAKKNFQIIIFTASQQSYADAILDQIDPENSLIDHRLYRHHCVKICDKIYIKDLSIINRDLSKTVLVDNSPFSYLPQIQNGIPILSYNGGDDTQLLSLQKYLEQIQKEEDVRSLNMKTFKLHKYKLYEDCQELAKQLYCNKCEQFGFHY